MSYTFTQTGSEIQAILGRAEAGGQIDQDIAAKAPLASPALTGDPTAPTQSEGDNSAKLATTAYADRAASPALAAFATDEAIGAVASFSDGADGVPVKNMTVDIDYMAAGWTGASISRTGVNLLKVDNAAATQTYGVAYTPQTNGSVVISGTKTTSGAGGYALNSNTGIVNFPTGVTLRAKLTGATYHALQVYVDGTSVQYGTDFTFTVPRTATSCYIRLRISGNQNVDVSETVYPMVVVDGVTAPFAPYDGQTITIDWTDEAGTVYGGTLDVANGVLTSNKAADGSDITPVVYNIGKTAVPTLLGNNNIWSDTGDVTELTYRADTSLYIQKVVNGGAVSTLSMAAPSPSLSLGRVGVLAEQEVAEPEPDDAEPEAEEASEEPEEQEAEEE